MRLKGPAVRYLKVQRLQPSVAKRRKSSIGEESLSGLSPAAASLATTLNIHAAVIGGGVSGLASALRLAERGASVTLFESDEALGGLGATFDVRGVALEKFYHCLLPSDDALLGMLIELGLERSIHWRRTGMGFMHRGRIYSLNTALDVLRFAPLPMVDRLRMGWMGLRAQSRTDFRELDEWAIADFLRSHVGDRAYEVLWKPLLDAKLGDGHAGIPALWLISRIQREKSSQKEVKGFVDGGYRAIVAAIERALHGRGVDVRTKSKALAIERDGERMRVRLEGGASESFDCVVSTAPLIDFQRMTSGLGLDAKLAGLKLDYQGVISGVFLMKRALTKYYWMPVVDCGATCQGAIEMSNLVPVERSHGLHVNYLVNYTHRDGELYRKSDAELLALYRADLARLFPGSEREIAEAHLFRAPYVEPIWPLGFSQKKPKGSVIPGRLYLASTAQVYPHVNSWNSCVEVVEGVVAELERDVAGRLQPVGARGA